MHVCMYIHMYSCMMYRMHGKRQSRLASPREGKYGRWKAFEETTPVEIHHFGLINTREGVAGPPLPTISPFLPTLYPAGLVRRFKSYVRCVKRKSDDFTQNLMVEENFYFPRISSLQCICSVCVVYFISLGFIVYIM